MSRCRTCFKERFSVEWLRAQVDDMLAGAQAFAVGRSAAYHLGALEGALRCKLLEHAERLCRCEAEPMVHPKRARTWSRHIPGCRLKIQHDAGMLPKLCPSCGKAWAAA